MTRRFAVSMLAIGALGLTTLSAARPLHYGAVDDPALLACDRLAWRGKDDDAANCYAGILAGTHTRAVRAEAAWAQGDLHGANRLFQAASQAAADPADVLARWGDLYAASHQDGEAMELYREALALNGQHPFALLGAARLLAGSFDEAANQYLEPLLTNSTLHPGARAAAWLLVAGIALEQGDLAEASAHLDEAEALVEQHDWPPLEVLALRSARDLVAEEASGDWTAASLAYNPNWGGIFETPAWYHVIARRYRDAIDLYQRAVDVEPGLASAHESMGVNLLRDNQFPRARRHLETAHELDPFSPIAVNTLRLLDSLSDFAVIQDPDLPPGDGDEKVVPIVLRLHEDEAAAIAPYAIDMIRRSIDEFSARYEFELSEPVVVEMYPDHEDFAVRTAGMPGIGILGATFGYVVAMDSPSARSPDAFQWGTTLWHELAHVFTLEASGHRVPRWFSEGVSVYEEWKSGPTPGVRIPIPVYQAMSEERFLPVAILDQGFMRPTYENQVIVSYMQAGLVCQYIGEHYGDARLAAMLRAFADGADTRDAFRDVLDVETPAFDRDFETWLDLKHGTFLDVLDAWHELQADAARAASENDWQGLLDAANELIALHPDYAEPDSPYLMLAKAYAELGDEAGEARALATFRRRGGFAADALNRYAGILRGQGNTDAAIEVLDTVIMVQPLDVELHQSLGELLLTRGDARQALREFEIVLAQDTHDKASAYYQLARAHHALGNKEQTRDSLLQALDVAPGYRDAQRMLLDVMRN